MDTTTERIVRNAREVFLCLEGLDMEKRVVAINAIRKELHKHSPFNTEPVDCVQWIPADEVQANEYNPNKVAPPEMKLLEHSIHEDGYTQPIVAWWAGQYYEVVDGFHRNRVGKESKEVKERVHGYLPLSIINSDREGFGDRVASTIRHNRARGKHSIDGMANIVIDLKKRNWSDKKIGRELGMDPDEILRLSQITGLAEMFSDKEFSEAWDVDSINEEDDLSTELEGVDSEED